jgi:hypothetical protein
MAWKTIVFAGLVSFIASTGIAAPTIMVVPGGIRSNGSLDVDGNWVWRVQISPSFPIPTGSTPLNAELGFVVAGLNAEFLGATKLSSGPGDDFYLDNPGEVIFGWETTQDVDPGPGVEMKALGLQLNTDTNQVFSALGSQVYTTVFDEPSKPYIQIKVLGPCYGDGGTCSTASPRLTSTIQWLGAYNGKGRIQERNPTPPPTMLNYDTYAGSVTFTTLPGDANMDTSVDTSDYGHLLDRFGVPPAQATWSNADFNDDNSVDTYDYNIWLTHIGTGAGSGVDSGASVPEPSGLALGSMLGSMLGARLRVRRR